MTLIADNSTASRIAALLTLAGVAATPRQLRVLEVIAAYREGHGVSPTLQEIGDATRVNKVTAMHHVESLVRKGVLLSGHGKARGIRFAPQFDPDRAARLNSAALALAEWAWDNSPTFKNYLTLDRRQELAPLLVAYREAR